MMTLVPFVDRSQLEIGHSDRSFLTCFGVLTRGQMAECTMRSALVVIDAPRLESFPCCVDRDKVIGVQAFVTQAAVEGFA